MGNSGASHSDSLEFEAPSKLADATLYYFEGRGKADQIRWMLAATNISFVQKSVTTRERYIKMSERQLAFGQLPLLQIDNIELVQTQPIIRYLAKRANINGTTPQDEVKCDMIADIIHDLVSIAYSAPFRKCLSDEEKSRNLQLMRERWETIGTRLETILSANGGKFIVGKSLTYTDILLAHCITWYVEECGPDLLEMMPLLVDLQCAVMTMPPIHKFIQSNLYFPLGDIDYVIQVSDVMALPLPSTVANIITARKQQIQADTTTATPTKKDVK